MTTPHARRWAAARASTPGPAGRRRPPSSTSSMSTNACSRAVASLPRMDVATDRMPLLTREALALAERAEPDRARYTDLAAYYPTRVTEWLLLAAKLLQRDDLRFDRILEIGCGHGFNLPLWRLLAGEVVGIDLPGEVELSKPFLARHAPDGSITTY